MDLRFRPETECRPLADASQNHLPGTTVASQLREFTEALLFHDWKHSFPLDEEVHVRALDYADILLGEIDADHFDLEYLPLIAVANTANDLLYNNSLVEEILNTVIADKSV